MGLGLRVLGWMEKSCTITEATNNAAIPEVGDILNRARFPPFTVLPRQTSLRDCGVR